MHDPADPPAASNPRLTLPGAALLNSERIAACFGNCGIEILAQEGFDRFVSLFSRHDGVPTCRTYAVARFAPDVPAGATIPHAAIMAGNSIGAAFKACGIAIRKRSLHVTGIAGGGPGSALLRHMRIRGDSLLAAHVYRLEVPDGAGFSGYATIAEVHHPDYLSIADVENMAAVESVSPASRRLSDELLRRLIAGPGRPAAFVAPDHCG